MVIAPQSLPAASTFCVAVVVLRSKSQGLPGSAAAAALKRFASFFFAHSQLEIWLSGLNNSGVPTDGMVAKQRSSATSARYWTSIITGPRCPSAVTHRTASTPSPLRLRQLPQCGKSVVQQRLMKEARSSSSPSSTFTPASIHPSIFELCFHPPTPRRSGEGRWIHLALLFQGGGKTLKVNSPFSDARFLLATSNVYLL